LTISGNFLNSGLFIHNNGEVDLASSSVESTVSGTTEFYDLVSTSSGKVIKFEKETSGSPTFTFDGTLDLEGISGDNIVLESDTSGRQWLADFNSSQNLINFVSIKDSGCVNGSESVTSFANNTDQGNNGICWGFPVAATASDNGAETIHHSSSGSLVRRLSIPFAPGIVFNPVSPLLTSTNYNLPTFFTKDLQLGKSDPEVYRLQMYLNNHGFPVSLSGAGSLGQETSYFGAKTRAALILFQKAHNIVPSVGYFGPKTRAFVAGN